ncbi:MAG: glucans biosynthesis protein [Wenzhouxiangella sp.]|nr:MAG: glucans biosynthesis protein [Wenzhouxiangella sp.]
MTHRYTFVLSERVNAGSGMALGLALLLLAGWSTQGRADPMGQVIERAEVLAASEWQPPNPPDPILAALDYDRYRAIRFDPDRALWRDSGRFRIQFFHPGFLYNEAVRIHEVDGDGVRAVPFDLSRFSFGPALEGSPSGAETAGGHAGFRVHYPINRPDRHDEFLVFLGASYFRLVGRDQVYGLSARGLALDSGGPGDEEFPVFREFWLIRPDSDADRMVVLALLDSPSLTGAYRFEVRPGDPSSIDVDAHLFAREDLVRPGIAPLTSMYTHGDTGPFLVDDFRPRVHDSDGLLVVSSRGEAQWRPLSNRARVRLSAFVDDAPPRGFGLLQRRREWAGFQDLEARYERRPGLWVEPLAGDWGSGRVELVEIPTADETHDNIVAFWVPDDPIDAGQSRHVAYRLTTVGDAEPLSGLARVQATRTGRAGLPGQETWRQRMQRRFVIDFHLDSPPEDEPVELYASTGAGDIVEARLERLPGDRALRAVIALDPDASGAPSDVRVFLHRADVPLSEVWTYVWYPEEFDRHL